LVARRKNRSLGIKIVFLELQSTKVNRDINYMIRLAFNIEFNANVNSSGLCYLRRVFSYLWLCCSFEPPFPRRRRRPLVEGVGSGSVEVFIITVRRRRHIIHGQAAVYAAVVAVGGWLGGVIGHLVVRSTDRGRGGRLKGIAMHNILIWFLAI